MAKVPEPDWLERLVDGEFHPELSTSGRGSEDSVHGSTTVLAQVACVAALAGDSWGEELTLIDPTVGRGIMLGTVARALRHTGRRVRARGIDIHAGMAGIATDTISTDDIEIDVKTANILTDSAFRNGEADLVVCEPPWGSPWRSLETDVLTRVASGWYAHGTGSVKDSSWLFVQRALDMVKPADAGGGRALIFMPPRALWDPHGRSVRRALVDLDAVEGIVRLPAGLAANTQTPLHMLVLNTARSVDRRNKVRVIDLQSYLIGTARHERRVTPEGLRLLWSALATKRQGPSNRIVNGHDLRRTRVELRRRDVPRSVSWRTELGTVDGPTTAARYGPIPLDSFAVGDHYVTFDVDQFFQRRSSILSTTTPSTRLAALLLAPPSVHKPSDPATSEATIWLPTGRGEATTTPPEVSGRVLRLTVDAALVSPGFLAGWLNSEDGQQAKADALVRAASGTVVSAVRSDLRSLWRLADELIVPLPHLALQEEVADALLVLRRAENLIQQARFDVWADASQADLTVSPFESLLDGSLDRWTSALPYPFATALWALTSTKTLDAQHRQIFHTWESYAAFLATVLLSVVGQDTELAFAEGSSLRKALEDAHLSMDRASVGTWNVVVQRLSARFRSMLASEDADEVARVRQLFGGASTAVISTIIGHRTVNLLSDVNAKRNAWTGHAGVPSPRTLQGQVDYLTQALEELRSEIRTAWSRLPLVRAGAARRRKGELIQDVELVMGTSVPFRPAAVRVGEMMEEGELYLATDGCARPVPLSHLVVLRPSPSDQHYACYFYSRADAHTVRLVSYQMTDSGELQEPRADLGIDMPWLLDN